MRELLNLGLVRKATAPEWLSSPLIVQNRSTDIYRLSVDYRPDNSATFQTFWPIPNIESDLSDGRGAKSFAVNYFCSGYWQAPHHVESQPLFAFMTPEGLVILTRTTQGVTNAAYNFQVKVSACFSELNENFMEWIDYFIIFAKDESELIQPLRRFCEICRSLNHVISLPMSDLFPKQAQWCGRNINAEDVTLKPKHLSGLKDGDNHRTVVEL